MATLLKNTLAMATLGLTIGLVGCGGDDNATYVFNDNGSNNNGSNGSNVTFKFTVFGREFDKNDNDTELDNITRDDFTFYNGGITFITKGLLKKAQQPASENDYEIGDNYLEVSEDYDVSGRKNVKVTKPTTDTYLISYNTVSQNNQKTNHTMTVKEVDISGVYDFAKKEASNFHIRADNTRFKKLPSAVTFPQGSSCFIFAKETQDRVTYGFSESDETDYTNLDNFLLRQYQVIPSSIKKINVGINNQSQVLEYQEGNHTGKSYAVLYNGKVYKNAYKNELEYVSNTDTSKGDVDCDELNPTAADYMEQQLIKAYK